MKNGYFDITQDKEYSFFCQACLVGKPLDDVSPDSRYCLNCYEVLVKEAELAPARARTTWRPVGKRVEALPVAEEVVAKLFDKGIPPAGVLQHPGGRPIKEGEVHRTTEWRRKKARSAKGYANTVAK